MRIGAIDVGSNSIKLLVAEPGTDPEPIRTIEHRIEETRLGSHLSGQLTEIPTEVLQQAVESIQHLVSRAREQECEQIVIVATSAVRDSANRDFFQQRIEAETGLTVRILAGEDEARLISLGLLQDPEMRHRNSIELADLGGGSLELVSYATGELRQAISLQLGSVRMMRQFVEDPTRSVNEETIRSIESHASAVFEESAFRFPENEELIAGLGGSMTLVRQLLAGAEQESPDQFRQTISAADITRLLEMTAPLDLAARKQLPNMNRARADVIVPALAVLHALLRFSRRPGFHQSHFNLRYGIVAELLNSA